MSTRGVTTSSLEIVNPLYSACPWVRTYNSRCELKIRQNTVQMDSSIHTCTSKKEVVYVKIKSVQMDQLDAFSRASLFLNFLSYSRQWYKISLDLAALHSKGVHNINYHFLCIWNPTCESVA